MQNVLSVNFLESALVNKELPHLLGRPGAVVCASSMNKMFIVSLSLDVVTIPNNQEEFCHFDLICIQLRSMKKLIRVECR